MNHIYMKLISNLKNIDYKKFNKNNLNNDKIIYLLIRDMNKKNKIEITKIFNFILNELRDNHINIDFETIIKKLYDLSLKIFKEEYKDNFKFIKELFTSISKEKNLVNNIQEENVLFKTSIDRTEDIIFNYLQLFPKEYYNINVLSIFDISGDGDDNYYQEPFIKSIIKINIKNTPYYFCPEEKKTSKKLEDLIDFKFEIEELEYQDLNDYNGLSLDNNKEERFLNSPINIKNLNLYNKLYKKINNIILTKENSKNSYLNKDLNIMF